jgi:hypothetical protein
LYSRDGGSPVWIPAFAGKHADLFSAINTIDPLTSNSHQTATTL